MHFLKQAVGFVGSRKFGLALFLWLFFLLFWGTLFSARAGLELSVARFFDSWFLKVAGVVPFPAMKALAVLIFANVLCAILSRIPHDLRSFGTVLIHVAVLVLIAGSFAGSAFRESFAAFGVAGGSIVLDSAAGVSFRILDADSNFAEIEAGTQKERLRVALNDPAKVGSYRVYFGETVPMIAEVKAVRFWIKRDPFAFVPALFSGILAAGACWNLVARRRR